jgi:hypothetical protein
VVAVVTSIVVASAATSLASGRGSFAFDIFWPSPAAYDPGSTPPTAYLQINYTGPGTGTFTYVITSNSTGVTAVIDSGTATVGSSAWFRDFVYVNVTSSAVVVLSAEVYRGAAAPQDLVYSKSVTL